MKAPSSRRALLSGLAVAPFVAAPVAASLTDAKVPPDAELVRLGRQLDDLWVEEIRVCAATEGHTSAATDEMLEAAFSRVRAVVSEIEPLPATTLAGLIVKARAVWWCHSGEPFTDTSFGSQGATNERIASAILRDLLAMGGEA